MTFLWYFMFAVFLGFQAKRSVLFFVPFSVAHVMAAIFVAVAFIWHIRYAGISVRRGWRPSWLHVAIIFIAISASLWYVARHAAQLSDLSATASPATSERSLGAADFPIRYDMHSAALGNPMQPDPNLALASSASCTGSSCHADLHRQWSISSHRYAASAQTYRKVVETLYSEAGPASTMQCSKCHAPMLAMLGKADDPNDPSLNGLRSQGIGCHYCHAIAEDQEASHNGNLQLEIHRTHLHMYPDANSSEAARMRRDAHVLQDLEGHRRSMRSRSDLCETCHTFVLEPEQTGGEHVVLRGELHTSRARENRDISCGGCHMILAEYDDPVHARPDHRMLGINNAMSISIRAPFPIEDDLAELDRATEAFLKGKGYLSPNYERLYTTLARMSIFGNAEPDPYSTYLHGNEKVSISVTAPSQGAPGTDVTVHVTVINRTGAHAIPAGMLDLNEFWIELTAVVNGRTIFSNAPSLVRMADT
jgi:hypothetical protein